MEKHFHNRFPVFLKKAHGGGGSDVYKVQNMDELCENYQQTIGRVFHIQEAIEDFDKHIRVIGIGPQFLFLQQQSSSDSGESIFLTQAPDLDPEVKERIKNYVRFNNAYHHWSYCSFECLIKDDSIYPIDFANGCTSSSLLFLQAFYLWFICSLIKWLVFIGVSNRESKVDLNRSQYLKVLNNPALSALEKYQFCVDSSREFYDEENFAVFCEKTLTICMRQWPIFAINILTRF